MKSILNVYKPVGKTPLEIITQLKKQYPEYADRRLGYAGRLDPMADGVLILLVDDENNNRKEIERFTKKYTFELLLGVETDTYDILGIVTGMSPKTVSLETTQLSALAQTYLGSWEQTYPPYSSPRVKGRPLFYWARENKLDEIIIPKKKITITSFITQEPTTITAKELHEYINHRIAQVSGDFRQHAILQKWEEVLAHQTFVRVRCFVECSSGTYIRSLAHDIGHKLGYGGIALSITRTAVGDHTLNDAINLTET